MSRGFCAVLVLCAVAHAQGAIHAKEIAEQKQIQRIRDLTRELRELAAGSPSGTARPSDQKRIFAEIATVPHPQAVRTLVGYADNPDYAPQREELLRILAGISGADETLVSRVMREHVAPDDPARSIPRAYLLEQALRRRKDEFPYSLFCFGTPEDKFLALQVMGRIESRHTLECATALQKDRSWSPDATGLMSCGTIIGSAERSEGPAAARLLLTLMKDPRFTPADAAMLREATRTWHETDLRSYVNLADLSDRDAFKRQETATFLGAVPLEAARAPLLRVACNRREVAEVRAAAATALGGMRIAREDLAEHLKALLTDPDPIVRAGATEGLGRLKVRQAAEALVSMLDGPFGPEIEATLPRLTGMRLGTDWRKWLRTAFPDDPKDPPGRK